MTVIDAHQHVWDPRRARYEWLTEALAPIDRPMCFEELRASLVRAGVDATVLVQSADNDEDTELMRETARMNPEVAAIVAFVPLNNPERAAERLAELYADPLVVGIRNLIHDIPDPDYILRPDVNEGLGLLEEQGLTFDYVSVLPRHLEHLPTLSERHPNLRIVIDHLAKPPVGLPQWEPWWSLIEIAAQNPNVYAKVSGLYSASGALGDWTVDAVRPHFERAVSVFGPERLMYGGDWPISALAGGYDRVWTGLSQLFEELGVDGRTAILGRTAQDFYRIDGARLKLGNEHHGSNPS